MVSQDSSVAQVHAVDTRERLEFALFALGLAAQGQDTATIDQLEALLSLMRGANHVRRVENRCAWFHFLRLAVRPRTYPGSSGGQGRLINRAMGETLSTEEA